MKKYLVINRSISNGGDFLINSCVMNVLQHFNSNNIYVNRSAFDILDINELNGYDGIIIGGGPGYDDRILNSEDISVFKLIDKINIPISFMGAGWYGSSGLDEIIYNYRFNDSSIKKLKRIEASGGVLGCRDNITKRVLKNNGFNNVIMTGCPAWYNPEYIGKEEIRNNADGNIRKIVISDPGLTKKSEEQYIRAKQAVSVIETVKSVFKNSQILFTFNNGIDTKYSSICNNTIKNYLEQNNIKYEILAYDEKKFAIYDEADLHIGYRVHSHIYCLSHRIPSLLIEEDARGYGVNEALGLKNIFSYKASSILNNKYEPNEFLFEDIKYSIKEMLETNFVKIRNAFRIIDQTYYNAMKEFLINIR